MIQRRAVQWLLNATVRATKANQFGILGFGGDKSNAYHTEFEGSAAYLFSRKFAVGVEYRTKPDNLSIAREDNTWDVFTPYEWRQVGSFIRLGQPERAHAIAAWLMTMRRPASCGPVCSRCS